MKPGQCLCPWWRMHSRVAGRFHTGIARAQGAAKTTAAIAVKDALPLIVRQPYFYADVRIGSGFY